MHALVGPTGLAADTTFSWTPVGAADFEFRSGERTIRLQCTTAHTQPNSLGEQGGHLRKLEMREANGERFNWRGGRVSEPAVQAQVTDLGNMANCHRRCVGEQDQGGLQRLLAAHLRSGLQHATWWNTTFARSSFRRPTASAERTGSRSLRGCISSVTCPRTLLRFEPTEDNKVGREGAFGRVADARLRASPRPRPFDRRFSGPRTRDR